MAVRVGWLLLGVATLIVVAVLFRYEYWPNFKDPTGSGGLDRRFDRWTGTVKSCTFEDCL